MLTQSWLMLSLPGDATHDGTTVKSQPRWTSASLQYRYFAIDKCGPSPLFAYGARKRREKTITEDSWEIAHIGIKCRRKIIAIARIVKQTIS